jgi:DNA-directed RNA polymerase subunit M/transcription elongation factor TFIIS
MVKRMCENCKTEDVCYCQKGICSANEMTTEYRCPECGHFKWPKDTVHIAGSGE